MGVKMIKALNDSMGYRPSADVRECEECGEEYEARSWNSMWCDRCRPIMRAERSRRRAYLYRRAREPQWDGEELPFMCRAEMLCWLMSKMAKSCPGPKYEDCRDCFFNQFACFVGECPKCDLAKVASMV